MICGKTKDHVAPLLAFVFLQHCIYSEKMRRGPRTLVQRFPPKIFYDKLGTLLRAIDNGAKTTSIGWVSGLTRRQLAHTLTSRHSPQHSPTVGAGGLKVLQLTNAATTNQPL
jgi:hypothetical protein